MTPTAGSDFSRYKIPDVINPSGVCCICVPVPDSREYRAQFMGAIWRMSLQTHYERDDAHSAQLVAAVWRQIWEDLTMAGCCNSGVQTQITIFMKMIQIQIYLQSLHQLWVDAVFDVDIAFYLVPDKFDTDPGDVGGQVSQRDRALCLASISFINELMNQAVAWIEDSVPGVVSIGIGVLLLPYVPMWIGSAGFAAAALALSKLHEQAADPDYREYLACAMYEALQGTDTSDSAAFASSLDSLPIRPPPPETVEQNLARDALEIWARSVINNVDNYLAFVSQLNAAFEIAAVLTDQDCPCTAEWEHTWVGGFNEAGDWTPEAYTTGWPVTTYNAGDDRWEGTCVTDAVVGARVKITFPETEITRIRVNSEWSSVRATGSQDTDIWGVFDPPGVPPYVIHSCGHGTGEGSHLCDTGTISEMLEEINIRSAAGVFGCPNPAAWTYITMIRINGSGVNPFV